MHVLLGIALKSLFIAGLTLGLLQLIKRRSAAERSWVAHIGLIALVLLAFAPIVLPSWTVEMPAMFAPQSAQVTAPVATNLSAVTPAPAATTAATTTSRFSLSPAATTMALYALPAAILLLITFIALARLIALRARADVLVDGHWLSALARAQRRMGFKHGTALLTSDELASPISWGLMRPVILLNSRAVEASGEAEAIIAHELAHVARMDWAKLLLARVATALFWFNPLVWVLAREAHQLREETADDAVLAADISDTDYAQLLVGVARHECPGLLLGAHGVAPSKTSLARRVARVLDGQSVRGPAARSFAAGVFVGAVLVAAPLAALTLAPAGTKEKQKAAAVVGTKTAPQTGYYAAGSDPEVPTDLGSIIADGVSTSVTTAVAAIAPVTSKTVDGRFAIRSDANGKTVLTQPSGARIEIFAPDSKGHRRAVLTGPSGGVIEYADASRVPGLSAAFAANSLPPMPPTPPIPPRAQSNAIDRAIEMKAVGVTPEYVAAIRSALPQLRLSQDDVVELKAVGVTPDFILELARQGYRNLDADDITDAYSVGVRTDYIRGMAAVGYPRLSLEQLTEMRAVGVTPKDVERFRRAGFTHLDVDQLVQAKTLGLTPEEIRAGRDSP
jgi:beta-lactamase regulating signal transducer with metallopeptidase domain